MKIKGDTIREGKALLAEEAKWKVLHSFSDGYMEIGKKKYGLECYISTEQDNGFVCTLDVTCG